MSKSLIPIEEGQTVAMLRAFNAEADAILAANNLPNPEKPFSTLLEQKKQPGAVPYDTNTHVESVKLNLQDNVIATAIANMEPEAYSRFKTDGGYDKFLKVPEELVTDKTPVQESVQQQIRKSNDLTEIRKLLLPEATIEAPRDSVATGVEESDWFWKPTGEVMFGIAGQAPMEIPVYPESVDDNTSATWSQEMTTFQHYEPKQTYKGSGPRTVSCTFKIHRAMWTGNQDDGNTEALIAYMESANYPDYEMQSADPPRVLLTIGNSIRIRGIMTSFGKKYHGPIGPDTKYDEVTLSITITEESDHVLSTQNVRGGLAGWR